MIYETKNHVIPDWVEQSEKTKTNSCLCEVCGQECTDRVIRKARHTYAEKRRTNRHRIDAGYFDSRYSWRVELEKAGMLEWANKLTCSDCYHKFTDVLNKTH